MMQIIRRLSGVTSLILSSSKAVDLPDFRLLLPVVRAGWSTFGSNLRTLLVDLSLEGICLAISPSTTFPRLEDLHIVLSSAYHTTDPSSILTGSIAPFINNHHSTLCSLQLKFLAEPVFSISPFLLRLRHFPHLSTFWLSNEFVSIHQSDSSGLQYVLESHAHQLTELSLHISQSFDVAQYFAVTTDAEWYGQGFLQLGLPNLKTLELRMQLFTDINLTSVYLQKIESSLTSLAMYSLNLSYDEITTLCSVFTRRNHLQKLSLTVDILSLQLLELFATKLSNLEVLCLKYEQFSSMPLDRFAVGPFQFQDTLRAYSQADKYAGRKLWYLAAKPQSYACDTISRRVECEKALRIALPNSITVVV